MSNESLNRNSSAKNNSNIVKYIRILAILIAIPATLFISWKFGSRRYYLTSVLVIIYSISAFFLSFENKRPMAREVVLLSVMCAIAVASRAAFMFLPHFKPLIGIVIITGISFGAEAGFLTGAMSALVSNFIFGQGPYTPWQMFAYGMAGFLAGYLYKRGIVTKNKVNLCTFGVLVVLLIVGPILDTCALFTMSDVIDTSIVGAIYLSGLPVNIIHATATGITLFLIGKPMFSKLDRIKAKYGIANE